MGWMDGWKELIDLLARAKRNRDRRVWAFQPLRAEIPRRERRELAPSLGKNKRRGKKKTNHQGSREPIRLRPIDAYRRDMCQIDGG